MGAVERYRFCPYCAAPLVLATIEGRDRLCCNACQEVFYENAKPCAGALVVREGKVLLGLRDREPHKGLWDIPGGFLEAEEHPEAGAIREVKEETGLDIQPDRLVGIYMDRYGEGATSHTLNVFYEAHVLGGSELPSSDLAAMQWFPVDQLPAWGEIAFENAGHAIRDWLSQRKHGGFHPKTQGG